MLGVTDPFMLAPIGGARFLVGLVLLVLLDVLVFLGILVFLGKTKAPSRG